MSTVLARAAVAVTICRGSAHGLPRGGRPHPPRRPPLVDVPGNSRSRHRRPAVGQLQPPYSVEAVTEQRAVGKGWSSRPPMAVGCSDRLELDGDHLGRGGEAVGSGGVVRPAALQNVQVGLDVVDGVASQGQGRCTPFLGCFGEQLPRKGARRLAAVNDPLTADDTPSRRCLAKSPGLPSWTLRVPGSTRDPRPRTCSG